ncbi:MAG: sialate O-acetylesterase [Verrucomicrobia subdivision 3 bacterium]|nr:sialate O-acetylesterase [Limisphaerales bacterium]
MHRCIFLLGLVAFAARADVKLPAIFSDHMVLQRGAVAPIWGWADAGETVTVQFAGQSKIATADKHGQWRVRLDAINDATVKGALTVKGNNTLTIKDVLVGEVWLASGQSNMAMTVGRCRDAAKEKAAAKFPAIRMFTTQRSAHLEPQIDCTGAWAVCAPETVYGFSGTAYFFARALHKKLNVPVGIVHSSWGGTAVEAWTSIDVQTGDKKLAPVFAQWKGKPKADRNKPANLFNGMIAPILPYGIRGAIWYQGERNARTVDTSKLYAHQLPMLINNWRRRWGQGDFPFLWVQLPNFKTRNDDPNAVSAWAHMRESMARTLALPNTGMATAIDIGEAKDIHPKNKQDAGTRLANWALAEFYGKADVTATGPMYASHQIKGNTVTVQFKHAVGLQAKEARVVTGFALAGADKKFHWATATVNEDGAVEVSCDAVKKPVAVRYGWGDNPDCNLVNQVKLPAAPFRTDDW